jgi:hypothetical protein
MKNGISYEHMQICSYGPARVAGRLWNPAKAAEGSPLLLVVGCCPFESVVDAGLVTSNTSPV